MALNKEQKDVIEKSSLSSEEQEKLVEDLESSADDKDINVGNLRKKIEDLEKEKEDREEKEKKARDLSLKKEEEEDDEEKKKKEEEERKKKEEEENKEGSPIFKRDLKEASLKWNKANKASKEEWEEVKKNIVLNGDETESEIIDKIDNTFKNIPAVRKRLDDELVNKGKKQAMENFQDSELDIGGGSGEGGEEGEEVTQLNRKENKFVNGMITGKGAKKRRENVRKGIDKEADASEETILDPAYQDN